MKNHIIANIVMLSTSEGGRKNDTPKNKFGCIFEVNSRRFECRLDLIKVGSLSPGIQAIIPVEFMSPDLVEPYLLEGVEFSLWEFSKVATGTILSICK